MLRRLTATVLFSSIVALAGCAGRDLVTDPSEPSRKFAGTSYYEEGEELFISVDLRAAHIGGPQNLLPLYLVLVKHKGSDFLALGRESFVLELPDKTLVPLASYEEYEKDYQRGRADMRMVDQFVNTIAGRFPEPPYVWLPLEFFPLRASGVFPRDKIDLRAHQVIHGYLYFPLPDDPPRDERYTLLVTPLDTGLTYVVDFPPFEDDRKSR